MTPEERAEKLVEDMPVGGYDFDFDHEGAREMIAASIREAVLAERERIALLAGAVKASYYVYTPLRSGTGESITSAPFADRIREEPA